MKRKQRCSIANCNNEAKLTRRGKKLKRNLCIPCHRAYELGYKEGYYHKRKEEKKNV